MLYVIAGFGAVVLVPLASAFLFLWGLGGLLKIRSAAEQDDEET